MTRLLSLLLLSVLLFCSGQPAYSIDAKSKNNETEAKIAMKDGLYAKIATAQGRYPCSSSIPPKRRSP